ncbi:MAG: aspartate-semialdehyde dehydrogenase, partial [Bacteroidetes bacterium]|nr:aspartate-semialdehyde dehydrogenase [Bacteroidota bacterium]
NSHSISANIELGQKVSIEQIRNIMKNQNGIILLDDIKNKIYPQPQLSNGHDEVFVGRIRIDDSVENGIYLWITADNLRKGAASNAVQIAQLLIK